MTRIITDGAEMGDTLFWANYGAYCNVDTSPKRSGAYCYHLTNSGFYFNTGDLTAFYFRFGVYCASVNAALFQFRHGTTVLGDIYWSYSTNKMLARVNGVTVGTSISDYSSARWILIESYYNISDTGNFDMRIEGLQEITYSGDTQPGADTHIDNIANGTPINQHFYFDDIAVNDTNGSVDNSWCGDGWIIRLAPSGSGTTNSWLNSGSVSGSANYLYVDEVPKDDDTTYTYISASSTGSQDQYALSDFTGATRSNILRIWAETRAKMATTGSDVIKLGYLPSGGTDQLSGSIALTTSYTRILGTSASANPVTGLAWTIDDINALEYVIEVG